MSPFIPNDIPAVAPARRKTNTFVRANMMRLLPTAIICLLTWGIQMSSAFVTPPLRCKPLLPSHIDPSRIHTLLSMAAGAASSVDATETFVTTILITPLSRDESISLLNTHLSPEVEHGDRVRAGRDAQGISRFEPIENDDPRMALTYGEFPLESFDALMDLAEGQLVASSGGQAAAANAPTTRKMVDLGSGCGRLVLHAALTRCRIQNGAHGTCYYDEFHGIELSGLLHDQALLSVERAVAQGLLLGRRPNDEGGGLPEGRSTMHLHRGSAEDLAHVLADMDVIFAYASIWPTIGFSEELRALVVAAEWSEMLSRVCKSGCVVVTTDRVLDPGYGWEVVDRLEVANPETFGSTGYVQVLRKRGQ